MMKKRFISSILLTLSVLSLATTTAFAENTQQPNEPKAPPFGRELTEAERKAWETKFSDEEKAKQQALNEAIEKEVKANTPASVTGEKFEGNGTVVDFSTSGSKAFYTIQDQKQQVFYLIIDLDKVENNVYFLSEIDKEDLANSSNPAPVVPVTQEQPIAEPAPIQESNNNGFLLTILVVGISGAVGYYFLVLKPKGKQGNNKKTTSSSEGEVVIGGDES